MKKKIIAVLAALVLLCSSSTISLAQGGLQAQGKTPDQITNRAQAFQSLNNIVGDVSYTEDNGQFFLSGTLSAKKSATAGNALQFLQDYRFIFGLNSASDELSKGQSFKDGKDSFVRFGQKIDGIPVDGASVTVHYDANGQITSVNGYLLKDTTLTKQGDMISEGDAVAIAKQQYKFNSLRLEPTPEKVVVTVDKKNYVAYKVNIFSWDPKIINYNVFVDAYSGTVLRSDDQVKTLTAKNGDVPGAALSAPSSLSDTGAVGKLPQSAIKQKAGLMSTATGTGIDVTKVKRTLNLVYDDYYDWYVLWDLSRPMSTTQGIYTLTLDYSDYYPDDGFFIGYPTNTIKDEYSKTMVSAHFFAGKVIDFYKNLYNRDSLDNDGMEIDSYTHLDYDYNNAFWDGREMVYGDGDGQMFTYLSGDLDVVGHEMTHGVVSNTCNLQYSYQSGAMNESLADTFGVLIETYAKYNVAGGGSWKFNAADWVVGDQIFTPHKSGDALRSLADPHNKKAGADYWQPATMSEYVDTDDDNGGVHTNSGIPNHAAFLVAKSIGMAKTANIYYHAMTDYMGPWTDFEIAGLCLQQSAKDLYGASTAEYNAVKNAYAAVGIQVPTANDPYEPNNNIRSAAMIYPGSTQAYMLSYGDDDWYTFPVNTLSTINIKVSNIPDDNSFFVVLLDPDGNYCNSYDDEYGYHSTLSFSYAPSETGNYYLYIYTYDEGSTTQPYTITISPYVTSVAMSQDTATLYMGDTLQLTATINPDAAHVLDSHLNWATDNASVATVDSNGLVTPVANGTAVITAAKDGGGVSGACTVTVCTHPTGVTLNKADCGMLIGDTMTLTPTVAPASATNKTITWSSGNSSIAAVDANTGVITGVAEGDVAITATTNDGGFHASCTVHVRTAYEFQTTQPDLVSAQTASYNSIVLTWHEDLGATGYDIYRSTTQNSGYTKIASTAAFTYPDTGLTTGTTYYYYIVGTRASAPTVSPTSEVRFAAPIPSAPSTFSLSVASYNSVKVSWSAVAGATKYEVYCILPDSTTKLLTTTTALNYTHKSLLTGQTYSYYVRAYRKVGSVITEGAYTSTLSIAPYLLAPASPKAARASSTSIKVTWKSVAGASGYQVYRRVGAGGSFSLLTTLKGTSYTDKGLATGTTCYYIIVAYRTVTGYPTAYSFDSATVSATP